MQLHRHSTGAAVTVTTATGMGVMKIVTTTAEDMVATKKWCTETAATAISAGTITGTG